MVKNQMKKHCMNFLAFSDGDSQLTETWKRMMTLVGNEKESYDALRANKRSMKI